jgi:hypothetical protein
MWNAKRAQWGGFPIEKLEADPDLMMKEIS